MRGRAGAAGSLNWAVSVTHEAGNTCIYVNKHMWRQSDRDESVSAESAADEVIAATLNELRELHREVRPSPFAGLARMKGPVNKAFIRLGAQVCIMTSAR